FWIDIYAHHLIVDPNPEITLLLKKIEKTARLSLRWNANPESDECALACEFVQHLIGDRLGGFRADLTVAGWTKGARDAREEQFQIIGDLSHRANGRTRTLDRIRLLDRDGGRYAPNIVHPRFVHAVEELPHVRTERFDVAALAFGVNRFESETRLAAPARAGNDGQFTEGKIDIDAFEIVLARSANLHPTRRGWRGDAFFCSNLRTHWRYSVRANRDANQIGYRTRQPAPFRKGQSIK